MLWPHLRVNPKNANVNRLLQNALFYSGYALFTLIYIPIAVVLGTPVALLISHRAALRMTRKLIHYYGAVTVRLGWPWIRLCVKNSSGIVPGEPCLFISNHQSIADPYFMSLFPNEIVFISNWWPFRIPLLGFFAKLAGYLNAQNLVPEVLFEEGQKRLKEGVSLLSYAEGTRTRTGEVGPFHSTPFRLALQTHVPIIPVCIAGLYQIIPPGTKFLRPGIIHVHALEAIQPGDFEHLSVHQLKQKVRSLIAAELTMLKGNTLCS